MLAVAIARPVFSVRASGAPHKSCRTKIKIRDVKLAIQQAQNICWGHEEEPACRVAWDRVEELSSALARQREWELLIQNQLEICAEDPLSCREYDV